MATETEKLINALTVEVTTLKAQVEVLRNDTAVLQPLTLELAALKEQIATLRGETAPLREMTNDAAVLKHQMAELAKVKESWGNRIWLVVTITLSAFFATLTAILGALLTFTLNAKK